MDADRAMPMQRVLVTGAAGGIGRALRQGLRGRYRLLRLTDVAPLGAASPGEEVLRADICDMASTEASMAGIDCVVHLAAISEEDGWDKILSINIVGTYNVFEAARRQGVRRVVFASSNHVVGYHRRETVLDATALVRPDSRYGVSKVFGEALGRAYADKHGISVACLRIGSFQERPRDRRQLSTWISHRDMVQLAARAIETPGYRFIVAYGQSANARAWWDNSGAAMLGYRPEDNAEIFASDLMSRDEPDDAIAERFHGGTYCSMEFTGDPGRID